MATLNWVGKQAVINHDKEVPFKLLKKVKSASVGSSQNLIVHGDNLEALKALMPHYQGRVKCIYIDPPYNTGNEGWVYNDKVNSPVIRRWLKKVVNADDLTRHDKWLCMMYPRLKLLRDLLAESGVLFISIDDNALRYLSLLVEDIFGVGSFDVIVWRKSGEGRDGKMKNTTTFRKDHEYIVVVFKDNQILNKIIELPDFQNEYPNPDNDPRGGYKAGSISRIESASNPNHENYYTVISPSGKKFTRQFDVPQEKFEVLDKDGRIYWGKNGDAVPALKIFTGEERQITPYSIFLQKGTTSEGKKEIREIFELEDNDPDPFPNPKPSQLIRTLIQLATEKDSLILDSFAGSGTTGQAVLEQNKKDGGTRKFVLVEMEDEIAKNITAERMKRVIKSRSYADGFEYCELDKPLFNEHGQIEETCDFDQFATYIYFTETQTNIDRAKVKGNYIGERGNTEYYLIYKEPHANDLDASFLKKIEKGGAKKVVYADRCTLDEGVLAEYNLVFKQIPYEVKIY